MIEALLGIVILAAAAVIAYAVLRLPGDDQSASESDEDEELLGLSAGNWERIGKEG